MAIRDDGNGHVRLEAKVSKRNVWVPIAGAALGSALLLSGLETLVQDVLKMVKGVEAQEVRMVQLEERVQRTEQLLDKLGETVVLLGQTTARLTAVVELRHASDKKEGS